MALPKKVSLVTLDLVMGSRILLSLLNERGCSANLMQVNLRYTDDLTPEDMELIYQHVADSDVVGMAFTSIFAPAGRTLGLFLKERGVRNLVVGGSHATALPEEVMEYADVAVIYEAEITLPLVLEALGDAGKLAGIKGIHYKIDGKLHADRSAPELVWNLDELPFQSLDTEMIRYFDTQKKIYTPEATQLFPKAGSYYMLASRGCPYSCTYCSNHFYHAMDKRFKRIRKRSVESILTEMEQALKIGYEAFHLIDDHFFAFTMEEIEDFCRQYPRRINRPFLVAGMNPNDFRNASAEAKLKMLLEAGLTDIRIGIQSGSNRTLAEFRRGYKAEELPALLAVIDRHRATIWPHPHDRMHVWLDFIADSPWETDQDKQATLELALDVLKEYSINTFTLVYLPGTELYDRAFKEGWVKDRVRDIYQRGIAGVDDNIFNRLMFLIAVFKERGVTPARELIHHLLDVARTDEEKAKGIVTGLLKMVHELEVHHNVDLTHAVSHPYLAGYTEWTKTSGDVGRKVLFRSYHEAYG
jgi:radical SAM superfamily enzyme YgiQ (UPF0313 family)